jgi:hypothetical protein
MPALLHKLNDTSAEYPGFEASSNVKHEFRELYDAAAEPSARAGRIQKADVTLSS